MNNPLTRPELPDHLSIHNTSLFYSAAVFTHGVGICLNVKKRGDVEEDCLSEGCVKVPACKIGSRKGQPLLTMIKGKVEALYKQTFATLSTSVC